MRWILIATLLTLTAYANQGFGVHQRVCPKGETYMIEQSAKFEINFGTKTGKIVPNSGRPISRCVKVNKKKQIPDTPHVMKILKYGAPYGTGQTFPSKDLCEKEQAKLSKANAGLDYSYKCVKK